MQAPINATVKPGIAPPGLSPGTFRVLNAFDTYTRHPPFIKAGDYRGMIRKKANWFCDKIMLTRDES